MSKPITTSKSGIDFKRVLKKYRKNWYLFVITIVIGYLYANNSNKYIIPIYSLSTSVLIEDKTNSSILEERASISASPSFLSSKLIENQIASLKSFVQIKRIIEQLDFEVSYFAKGKYTWDEIYKRSPFIVNFDKEHSQVRYRRIDLKFISENEFILWSEHNPFKQPKTYRFGEDIISSNCNFKIELKEGINPLHYTNQEYGFIINSIDGVTNECRNKTSSHIEGGTSVLIISSHGPNKQKEKDYLNKLTKVFLLSNLEKKNKILTNTIIFINSQLVGIGKSLDESEQRLEEYRKNHKFMQLNAKAAGLLSKMNSQSKTRSNLLLDLKYYEYLQEYLIAHNNFDDVVMPSTVGLSLPLFSDLVLKLSTVTLKKEDLIANSSRENPYIETLEEEMENMKVALIENINSIVYTTNIKIEDIEERMMVTDEEFSKLPGIEREYLEIQRKYKIYNNLFDFLLKRKSEVEIQRAANMSDHEIIDYAGDTGIGKISKSPKSAYVNAILWAIVLPSVFLFLVVLLNNRVMAREDIESHTDVPIIGSLIKNPEKNGNYVLKSPNSYFSELLRIIRIKLKLDPAQGKQVVAVTSAMIDEGKTFFSVNFASVYALTGKRTLLLGFDLRRPNIANEFNLDPNKGITDYLINDLNLDDVIQKTFTKNLDILLSGPIPPNPDELIESEKTQQLFLELKQKYDYIIMDTSPIGLVGDAYLLNKYADATIFIVRHNFSTKKNFSSAIKEAKNNKMKNLHIVYNDVKSKRDKYDNQFYSDAEPQKYFVRIILSIRQFVVDLLRKF